MHCKNKYAPIMQNKDTSLKSFAISQSAIEEKLKISKQVFVSNRMPHASFCSNKDRTYSYLRRLIPETTQSHSNRKIEIFPKPDFWTRSSTKFYEIYLVRKLQYILYGTWPKKIPSSSSDCSHLSVVLTLYNSRPVQIASGRGIIPNCIHSRYKSGLQGVLFEISNC